MPHRRRSKNSKTENAKTLYICLPRVIHNKEEIAGLLVGEFKIKLYRQASTHCRVIFSTPEEVIKNLALLKNRTIDGKHVIAHSGLSAVHKTNPTKLKKKISVPSAKSDIKITQSIYISNVKGGTTTREIKEVLPGCVSVTLLKSYKHNIRGAIAKMENLQIASEYLMKKREWPILNGKKLTMHPDKRRRHGKKADRDMSLQNSSIGEMNDKDKVLSDMDDTDGTENAS